MTFIKIAKSKILKGMTLERSEKIRGLFIVPKNFQMTFWGNGYSLKHFVKKKEVVFPLTEATVAAQFIQAGWDVRIVDQNVRELKDEDLEWADYALLSGMAIHKNSIEETIARCKKKGVRTIGGGPFFTLQEKRTQGVDHLILNESEVNLPRFFEDREKGCPKPIYEVQMNEKGQYTEFADISKTPIPAFHLFDFKDYQMAMLQYCRGCPWGCSFCCVCVKDGRKTRCKAPDQFIGEVQALYDAGYKKGTLFINCDNIVGNRKEARKMLRALAAWQKAHNFPYKIMIQCDVLVPDDILQLFYEAGVDRAFLGIESPMKESLASVNKHQNQRVDPVEVVRKFASYGIAVSTGIMMGFKYDTKAVFDKIIKFVGNLRTPEAMAGALVALDRTPIKREYEEQGRILDTPLIGENADDTNFIPEGMSLEELREGVRYVRTTLFTPENYYDRIHGMIEWLSPTVHKRSSVPSRTELAILLRAFVKIGFSRRRHLFWRLIKETARTKPFALEYAFHQAITGEHYFRSTGTVK